MAKNQDPTGDPWQVAPEEMFPGRLTPETFRALLTPLVAVTDQHALVTPCTLNDIADKQIFHIPTGVTNDTELGRRFTLEREGEGFFETRQVIVFNEAGRQLFPPPGAPDEPIALVWASRKIDESDNNRGSFSVEADLRGPSLITMVCDGYAVGDAGMDLYRFAAQFGLTSIWNRLDTNPEKAKDSTEVLVVDEDLGRQMAEAWPTAFTLPLEK